MMSREERMLEIVQDIRRERTVLMRLTIQRNEIIQNLALINKRVRRQEDKIKTLAELPMKLEGV